VVTGRALPEAKAERVYAVERIGRREIEQSPSHGLDQLLKDVPGVQLFRRSDARSGHPTSQGVTLRALGGNASSRALLLLDGVPQSDPFGGWVNWPANYHNGASGLNFADGHSEIRKWRDPRTTPPKGKALSGGFFNPFRSAYNEDAYWLGVRSTVLR